MPAISRVQAKTQQSSPSPSKDVQDSASISKDDQSEKEEKLAQQVCSLKAWGAERGLSETEVSACLRTVLKHPGVKRPHSWSRAPKRCCTFLGVFLLVLLTLNWTWSHLYESQYETARSFINFFMRRVYLIQRFFRLWTYLLHERLNLASFHAASCVVDNPLYEEESPGCNVCKRVHTIKIVPDDFRVRMRNLYFPLIYKKRMPEVATLEDVEEMVRENQHALDSTSSYVSSEPWVKSASDLADPKVISKIYNTSDYKFTWTSKSLLVGQLFRKKFPRHESLPRESEVSILKLLYINGWETPPYEFDNPQRFSVGMYIQGTGMRKVLLTPPKECSNVCIPVSVLVNQSDILTFSMDIYKATVFQAGSNVSVGMLGFLL